MKLVVPFAALNLHAIVLGTGHSTAVLISNSNATAEAPNDSDSLDVVPGAVLDSLFANEEDIFFLKVDVEGFEGSDHFDIHFNMRDCCLNHAFPS